MSVGMTALTVERDLQHFSDISSEVQPPPFYMRVGDPYSHGAYTVMGKKQKTIMISNKQPKLTAKAIKERKTKKPPKLAEGKKSKRSDQK